LITNVEFDEEGNVIECLIEAIISETVYSIDWRDLKDTEQWLIGWK